MAQHRWLEIDARGVAFHERFLPEGVEPPREVFYCDCNGFGRETWNPQTALGTLDEWKAAHASDKDGCGIRRQIFVDVTAFKVQQAARGMIYTEQSATFAVPAGHLFDANDGAYVKGATV